MHLITSLLSNIMNVCLKTVGFCLIANLSLSGCMAKTNITYIGSLRQTAVKEIVHSNSHLRHLTITSKGGLTNEAYKIAMKIIEDKTTVEVQLLCLSACAEYLLPAAHEIIFTDDPLIGYHWNPLIIAEYLGKYYDRDIEYCDAVGDVELRQLLKQTNKNTEFWKIVLERLELTEFEAVYVEGSCPKRIDEYKYQLWFPTSEQLRNLAGLTFSGSVCADNYDVCTEKIDHIWPKGRTFLIGDRSYVSQGR